MRIAIVLESRLDRVDIGLGDGGTVPTARPHPQNRRKILTKVQPGERVRPHCHRVDQDWLAFGYRVDDVNPVVAVLTSLGRPNSDVGKPLVAIEAPEAKRIARQERAPYTAARPHHLPKEPADEIGGLGEHAKLQLIGAESLVSLKADAPNLLVFRGKALELRPSRHRNHRQSDGRGDPGHARANRRTHLAIARLWARFGLCRHSTSCEPRTSLEVREEAIVIRR